MAPGLSFLGMVRSLSFRGAPEELLKGAPNGHVGAHPMTRLERLDKEKHYVMKISAQSFQLKLALTEGEGSVRLTSSSK
jgi:hypothetical protein